MVSSICIYASHFQKVTIPRQQIRDFVLFLFVFSVPQHFGFFEKCQYIEMYFYYG